MPTKIAPIGAILSPVAGVVGPVPKDVPLRLKLAAALAFPDGSMTPSGLRKEAQRGKLVIERVAGKDYVTLAAIEEMRTQCRVQKSAPVSGSGQRAKRKGGLLRKQPGSFSTVEGISPQDALKAKLQQRMSA